MQLKNIVSGLVATSMVILAGCSTSDMQNIVSNGNAMSTTDKGLSATTPNKVQLFYTKQNTPKHYTVVGRVSAENYNVIGIEHTQIAIAQELKNQAASIGANGVININTGLAQTIGDAVIMK